MKCKHNGKGKKNLKRKPNWNEWIQLYFSHTGGEKAKEKTNLSNSCCMFFFFFFFFLAALMAWDISQARHWPHTTAVTRATTSVYILIHLVVKCVKQFWNYSRCLVTLGKWRHVLALWGVRIPTRDRSIKFWKREGKRDPYGGGLELEAMVWIHEFKIISGVPAVA